MDLSVIPSPCYVIDEAKFRRNLELIRSVQDRSGAKIILAFKAFSLWKVFPIVREYINQATASSIHEARLAYEEMGNPAHTYSPVYSEKDMDDIIRMSSHVTFNSVQQFKKYYERLMEAGVSPGLRINPEYSEVGTDLYNPCSPGSRLGVTSDELEKLGFPNGVEGLHFHSLCESRSFDLEKTLQAVEEKFGKNFESLYWINFGGGHLITHTEYDVEHLISLLKSFKERYPHLQVILEPGSAFAWETGVLVSEIQDVVENHGVKTAMLDVSFTCHMPDCLEMPYKP